jgi:adenosylhomocysteine nucleosidase
LRSRAQLLRPCGYHRSRQLPELTMSADLPAVLVVMALPLESQGLFERAGVPVLFTGIGKVNAAYALTRRLTEYRLARAPLPHVINFGTAGSRRHPTGTLIECAGFIQRDMDVTGLGVPLGTTPFEDIPARLDVSPVFADLPSGVCGSGDSFVVSACAHECDVLDMEGYALAKVCHFERATFNAVKYVTDGADHAAAANWQANLVRAAERFLRRFEQFSAR